MRTRSQRLRLVQLPDEVLSLILASLHTEDVVCFLKCARSCRGAVVHAAVLRHRALGVPTADVSTVPAVSALLHDEQMLGGVRLVPERRGELDVRTTIEVQRAERESIALIGRRPYNGYQIHDLRVSRSHLVLTVPEAQHHVIGTLARVIVTGQNVVLLWRGNTMFTLERYSAMDIHPGDRIELVGYADRFHSARTAAFLGNPCAYHVCSL